MKYQRIKISRDTDLVDPRKDYTQLTTMLCWHSRYDLGDANPYKRESPEHALKVLVSEHNPGFEEQLDEWWDKSSLSLQREHGDGFHYKSAYKSALRALHDEYMGKLVEEFEKHHVYLPLYLYDHSGITLSTGRFSCPWDSGQVGFIYISHDMAHKALGGDVFKDKTAWTEEKTKRCKEVLEGDVKIYNQYITGDVYGFEVQNIVYEFELPDEPIEACDDQFQWYFDDSCWGFYGDEPATNGMADHLSPAQLAAAKTAADKLDTWVLVEPVAEVASGQ